MVFFRCTVGGSGKGNTVTVTCAEEFAGLTITLAKTGKTYTKTCPSTSPYVVTFYGVENGTYTVSTTYEGQTYSETVVVQDISCVLSYGFNWKTWVDTASQLDSSDYDTLDEVLADEKALRELFLEHACVDYMAELTRSNEDLETVINNDYCAKWINLSDYALDFLHANEVIADLMDEADKYFYGEWALMPQVPKMTSNTAPYGTATGTNTHASAQYYDVFDGNTSGTTLGDYWTCSSGNVNGASVGYIFTSPLCVKRIMIMNAVRSGEQVLSTYKIQGYDGTNWLDITEVLTKTNTSNGGIEYVDIDNDTAYLGYRIYIITSTGTSYCSIQEIQFYAWEPKGNVPVMTSNTAPYGTVVFSSENTASNFNAWKAFDGDNSSTNVWGPTSNAAGQYIGYKFITPILVKKVNVKASLANTTGLPRQIKIQASNDNSTWTDVSETVTTNTSTNADNIITLNADKYYLYYRVYVVQNSSASGLFISYIQFYGRELKVSVPAMTSNTAPFGTAFSSSNDGTHSAWYAFDSDNSNGAVSALSPSTFDVGYDFGKLVKVKQVYLSNRNNSSVNAIKDYIIQGYDGENWVDVVPSTITNPNTQNLTTKTDIADTYGAYTKYRIHATSGYATYFIIGTLQFYGLDYSEKEFESGTTKKWLYDHGLELEPMEVSANGTSIATKNMDSLYIKLAAADNQYARFNTENTIDLTDYSLVRYILGEKLSGDVTPAIIVGSSKLTNSSWTGIVAQGDADNTKPYTNSLDISAVSQSLYVEMARRNSATTKNCERTVTELWLE